MSSSSLPRLSKWPFVLGDLVLVSLAVVVIYTQAGPLSLGAALICLAACAAGAWMAILPFLREHQAFLKLAEADRLATTVSEIQKLERVQESVTAATSHWQSIQQEARQTAVTAQETAERMRAELSEFCAFLQKAQDSEKGTLKLQVEKLRRAESEWLQAVVIILDHVFALHSAATRSGQPALATQMNHFQNACRDSVRRLGLMPFAPGVNEGFDPKLHQVEHGACNPQPGAALTEVVAIGYTYQGELVRRALVRTSAS
jgi:molecular chaperone GrpE (heat shock protein)